MKLVVARSLLGVMVSLGSVFVLYILVGGGVLGLLEDLSRLTVNDWMGIWLMILGAVIVGAVNGLWRAPVQLLIFGAALTPVALCGLWLTAFAGIRNLKLERQIWFVPLLVTIVSAIPTLGFGLSKLIVEYRSRQSH